MDSPARVRVERPCFNVRAFDLQPGDPFAANALDLESTVVISFQVRKKTFELALLKVTRRDGDTLPGFERFRLVLHRLEPAVKIVVRAA